MLVTSPRSSTFVLLRNRVFSIASVSYLPQANEAVSLNGFGVESLSSVSQSRCDGHGASRGSDKHEEVCVNRLKDRGSTPLASKLLVMSYLWGWIW